MRIIWLIFLGLVAAMLGYSRWQHLAALQPTRRVAAPLAEIRPISLRTPAHTQRQLTQADSIVFFALRQLGTNYCYAGTSPTIGFDCSGFVQYVFGHFQVPVPHSTALLISAGRPVPRAEARPGDIVVFTGTAATSTTPGHAGIVVTAGPGALRFVHSSSAKRESGVKISQVEGTDYERRFMQVRRVL